VRAICEPAGYDEELATCDEVSEFNCCVVREGPACVTSNALLVAFAGGWVGNPRWTPLFVVFLVDGGKATVYGIIISYHDCQSSITSHQHWRKSRGKKRVMYLQKDVARSCSKDR